MIQVTHFTDKPRLGDRLSHNVPLLSCKFSNLQSKISEKKGCVWLLFAGDGCGGGGGVLRERSRLHTLALNPEVSG